MMYWYEFVLIYFASGLFLIAIHKLRPILPPRDRAGYALLGILLVGLVAAWFLILKPYETFECLPPEQKNQILYATLINFPLGHLLFSWLLGWDIFGSGTFKERDSTQ